MGRNTFVELCRTEKEWTDLREVFIRSFLQYPLYRYLVRDEDKRAEFLRRYLTAHYNIHVKSGKSPLICIKMTDEKSQEGFRGRGTHEESQPILDESSNGGGKIVGGVLFVTPADHGIGWDNESDDVYAEAYRHVKLRQVDGAAFEKLQRYESWETKHVTSKIMGLKIPIWNGIFCAIDPAYSGNGCGSVNYSDCMQIMAQVQAERKHLVEAKRSTDGETTTGETQCFVSSLARLCGLTTKSSSSASAKSVNCEAETKRSYDFPIKILHAMSFLSHHAHIYPAPSRTVTNVKPLASHKANGARHNNGTTNLTPLVLALSHCQRAVQFHRKNGFQCVDAIPYDGPEDGDSPFSVHVLLNDMFGTGKMNEFAMKLGESKKFVRHEKELL